MAQEAAIPPRGPGLLEALRQYLLYRDYRPPSAKPQPRMISTAVMVAGFELDTVTWDYDQPKARLGVPADGFILWVNAGETLTSPPCGGIKLSIDARSFCMPWPDGVARSYAIAAYRNTYQGEEATDRVFDVSWSNVT